MKHLKRISFLLPMLCLMVLLAGCQDSGSETDGVETNESEVSNQTQQNASDIDIEGFGETSPINETETICEKEATDQVEPEDVIIPKADPLAKAITTAIVEQNRGKYLPGECYGVGYKIIETFEEDDTISIYALTEYVEYCFEDNILVNISGTNPKVLMRFCKTLEDNYDLIFYTRLDLFSDLPEEELEALVQPLIDSGNAYIYTEQDLQEVRAQADEDAAEYLRSINRIAEIGVRQDHDGQLLEELVSDESFLKELFKDDEMCLYPNWTGTTERIENGERYIYQTAFDEERQEIVYTKIEYSTDNVVKSIVVDVQNGTITQ